MSNEQIKFVDNNHVFNLYGRCMNGVIHALFISQLLLVVISFKICYNIQISTYIVRYNMYICGICKNAKILAGHK